MVGQQTKTFSMLPVNSKWSSPPPLFFFFFLLKCVRSHEKVIGNIEKEAEQVKINNTMDQAMQTEQTPFCVIEKPMSKTR